MKQTLIGIIVVVVLAAGGWYAYSTGAFKNFGTGTPSSTATSTDATQTVATVNGQAITRGQLTVAEQQLATQAGVSISTLDASTTKALEQQALDSLVSQALVIQAAAAGGYTASSTAVDEQLQKIKSQLGSEDAYQKALVQQGITEDQLKAQLAQQLAVQAYLEATLHLSKVTASSAEIQTLYNQVKAQQGTSTPALSDVKSQVEQLVISQKQQQQVNQLVQQLRTQANIQVLI